VQRWRGARFTSRRRVSAGRQDDAEESEEESVVQATGSGGRAQDEAIRVDAINREEIEEKL